MDCLRNSCSCHLSEEEREKPSHIELLYSKIATKSLDSREYTNFTFIFIYILYTDLFFMMELSWTLTLIFVLWEMWEVVGGTPGGRHHFQVIQQSSVWFPSGGNEVSIQLYPGQLTPTHTGTSSTKIKINSTVSIDKLPLVCETPGHLHHQYWPDNSWML